MVKLTGTFSKLGPFRAVVFGDFMLDRYTTGRVKRISPEGPVTILEVEKESSQPGGAGNASLNILAMGAKKVFAIGRIGKDDAGKELLEDLQNEGVDTSFFALQEEFATPVKNRLIASAQQLIRVDHERIQPLDKKLEETLIKRLPEILSCCDVVALSDYNKGFLSESFLAAIIKEANQRVIPIIVDPKGEDFTKYRHATVIKPNEKEAYLASQCPQGTSLADVANRLLQQTESRTILITRSQEGMSLFDQGGDRFDLPVKVREVKDVTGAGDTVLAVICSAIANGLNIQHAAMLANVAAGIAIEKIGCAQISLSQLARRLLEMDVESKIFDRDHLFALERVLIERTFALFLYDSKEGVTTALISALRKLSCQSEDDVIVFIQDENPNEEVIEILSSLNEVDFIVLGVKNFRRILEFGAKGSMYQLKNGLLATISEKETLQKMQNLQKSLA
jgi:D-glycero-beta-D-manno-heptose-7-phosphate kinase